MERVIDVSGDDPDMRGLRSIGAAKRDAAAQAGFAPERPVLEMRGQCGDCR